MSRLSSFSVEGAEAMNMLGLRALCLWLLCLVLLGCSERRDRASDAAPTFSELMPLFERACVQCHGLTKAEGGYRTTSYLTVTACTDDGKLATQPADERAPLIAVLSRSDHRDLLTEAEKVRLVRWVEAGAPQSRSVVHPVGILDSRSSAWHGKLAATDHWAPLRTPESKLACGRCHADSPATPEGVTSALEAAPSCKSCHSEPVGALACATCHGQGMRAYPPRDRCLFVPEAPHDAHTAHLTQSPFRAEPLRCEVCHQVPKAERLFSGKHANGIVDVAFDVALTGPGATYDPDQLRCSVGCHARGGERADLTWDSARTLDCNSCHLSPPKAHFPGECRSCHAEMGTTADSLRAGALHINGKTDLGNADGTCSACHGEGKGGWPADRTHRAHRDTRLTLAVQCEECHAVPTKIVASGHLDGEVGLRFSGRALGDGLAASFDATRRSCSEVACHLTARGGGEVSTPQWGEVLPQPERCVACHQTPPPPPHVQREGCGGSLCHGDEVAPSALGYQITEKGRAVHLDGVLKVGGLP